MDTESLHNNIETERGLAAVMKCFEKYLDKDRPETAILRLLELSLTKNDFALAYANIYVGYWEETVFPKCRKLPMQYRRYLDDVWGIWEGTEKELGCLWKT